MKQYLLFDLDGTLTDPKEGITTCVQYALKDFGIDEPDLDKLEPFIGPPLKESFRNFYNMTDEEADRAVAKYRERFQDTGIFENELYGGIHDLLRTLKAGGMHLAVASSKPTVYVERILKHFKIDKYFEVVVGSELDGTRVEKAQVVQEALHKFFGDQPIRYDQVYMIGDRKFDIEGARTFRIETVGVTYGYGTMEELKEAKADYIVQSVAELKKFLMREVEDAQRQKAGQGNLTADGKPAKKTDNKILMKLLVPFALYYLVRMTVVSISTVLMDMLSAPIPALRAFFVTQNADGTAAYSGNALVIAQAIGAAAAAAFIWKYAKPAITKTADEMKLAHLKKDSVKSYVFLAAATIGSAVGVNLLLELSGMVAASEEYQNTSLMQYGCSVVIGLICFGVVTPVAEEVLFRGIVYNCLRRFTKIPMAIVLSSFLFSAFHTNTVQSMYAFILGCLLAYAYEYFGNFQVPVIMHAGANVLVYLLTVTGIAQTAFVSWPVCVIALVAAALGFFLLYKEKKI